MHKAFRYFLSVFTLLNIHVIVGQGTGNNPYSRYGVGELSNNLGSVRNIGMGSAGVASRHHYYINHLNPAFLGNYRKMRLDSTTKLEMAFSTQFRNLTSANATQSSMGTNIAYITAAWPVSKHWGMSLGISPYSSVDYNINTEATVNNSVVTNRSEGRGGIYKISLSNGVGITRWAMLGLESGLLYGNITDMSLSNFADVNKLYSGFKVRNQFKGWDIKPGIAFRKELHYTRIDTIKTVTSDGIELKLDTVVIPRKLLINAGITYELVSGAEMIRTTNLFSVSSNNYIQDDSTINKNAYSLNMPGTLRAGISFELPRKMSANADLSYTNWNQFGSSDSSFRNTNFGGDTLQNTWGLNVGGEYSPGDIKQRSKTYRLGFSYTQLPVKLEGKTINDMSISIGTTIPFGRIKTQPMNNKIYPRINVALVLGQRGDNSGTLIKEQYFRVYASLLIHETWFHRRKID